MSEPVLRELVVSEPAAPEVAVSEPAPPEVVMPEVAVSEVAVSEVAVSEPAPSALVTREVVVSEVAGVTTSGSDPVGVGPVEDPRTESDLRTASVRSAGPESAIGPNVGAERGSARGNGLCPPAEPRPGRPGRHRPDRLVSVARAGPEGIDPTGW
jgi:hypothetical protein